MVKGNAKKVVEFIQDMLPVTTEFSDNYKVKLEGSLQTMFTDQEFHDRADRLGGFLQEYLTNTLGVNGFSSARIAAEFMGEEIEKPYSYADKARKLREFTNADLGTV